jgi:hypothetical protein
MTQDFERSKEVICGRNVTITSWFDTDTSSWRSGAPTHSFISEASQSEASPFTSRRSAIDRTVKLLSNRFQEDDAKAPRPESVRDAYWRRQV